MRRHIIVEGCDGAGKDRLISRLLGLFPDHTTHARASTSLGGPVANLADWVVQDAHTMESQPPSIYNRHPTVSEPIYAPLRTINPGLRGVWSNDVWVHTYRKVIAQEAVLVVCKPPLPVLLTTIKMQGKDAHLPGVYENIEAIYSAYSTLVWPGPVIRYDYTRDSPFIVASLIRKAQ